MLGAVVALSVPGFGAGWAGAPAPVPGSHGPPPRTALAAALATGPCAGPTVPARFVASLGVDSSAASTPPVSNVTLSVAYYYTWNYSPSRGPSTVSCVAATQTNVTGPAGTTTLDAPVPATSCGSGSCSYYAGPYGPVRFADAAGDPAGYFLAADRSGGAVTLAFVRALDALVLAPDGRDVVSVAAPTAVRGLPEAGNGGPSPATLGYDWHLDGSGWTVVSGAGSPNYTVIASPGAGPATVELWTNGSYNGTTVGAGPVTLDLSAVATAISGGSVDPTSLDADERTTLSVTGTGAGGYAYLARFTPGLGAAPVNASCATSVATGGLVDLACSTTVAYAQSGDAVPSVNLTNGYSVASRELSAVQVAPALDVSVTPSDLQVYVNATARVEVAATPGSGTPPYGPACLSAGDGRWFCSNASGGPWGFDVAWGGPATLGGVASVVDTAGVNRSAGFSVTVVERPTLSGIVASTSDPVVGANVSLASYLRGGAYPVAFWWNDSTPPGTLYAGAVDRAAPMLFRYVPTSGGNHTVTLTIVDALGTRESQTVYLAALPGEPTAIAPYGPAPAAAVPAGSPWRLALEALDAAGDRVPMPFPNESLRITGAGGNADGPVWVNGSRGLAWRATAGNASGGLLPLFPSWWRDGLLELNITPTRLGVVHLALVGPLGCAAASAGRLDFAVTPDTGHLLLSQPRVVDPGSRTNATLWRLADRFGNAAPGTLLVVDAVFGASNVTTYPVAEGNATASFVWVNFSAPSDVGGTVYVLGPTGTQLLALIRVPGAASASAGPWVVGGVLAAGATGAALGYGLRRRRARTRPGSEPDEDDLKRLADGRAHVLATARTDRPLPLAELGRGFPGTAPAGPELAEWVGSLVSEGALRAVVGPDGRPGFLRVPEPPEPPKLRVDVDAAVLDQALASRDGVDAPDAGGGGAR